MYDKPYNERKKEVSYSNTTKKTQRKFPWVLYIISEKLLRPSSQLLLLLQLLL